jgi:hypothetical protein
MKKIFEAFKGERGEVSSKRVVGILGAIALIGSMVYYNTDKLVEAVEWLSILALGFSAVEKFKKDGK